VKNALSLYWILLIFVTSNIRLLLQQFVDTTLLSNKPKKYTLK